MKRQKLVENLLFWTQFKLNKPYLVTKGLTISCFTKSDLPHLPTYISLERFVTTYQIGRAAESQEHSFTQTQVNSTAQGTRHGYISASQAM